MNNRLDIFRSEQRFLILTENLPAFMADISRILRPVSFSDKKVTRTIYFNNADYPIPWGYSVKARQYVKDFSSSVFINRKDVYRVEIKASGERNLRTKIQQELPLSRASQFLSDKLGLELRPYAVDEYSRSQFVSKAKEDLLRLTVDLDVRYGFFEEEAFKADWLGGEDFARVELKADPAYLTSSEYHQLRQIIAKHSPWPVVSKRQHAFSLIKFVLSKKGRPIFKELSDCEIEAKFSVNSQNPALLLLQIKDFFRTSMNDYYLNPAFTYTQEGGSVNHYWAAKDEAGREVDGLKLMFLGRVVKPVFKEDTIILPDSYGLGCVLERKEVKAQRFVYTRDSYDDLLREVANRQVYSKYVGHLYRSRRAIWLDNRTNGRIYHITLDRCLLPEGGTLWQMEVEYTGRYTSCSQKREKDEREVKEEIRHEVADLAQEVLSFCNQSGNVLSPTTTTKFNWLKANA